MFLRFFIYCVGTIPTGRVYLLYDSYGQHSTTLVTVTQGSLCPGIAATSSDNRPTNNTVLYNIAKIYVLRLPSLPGYDGYVWGYVHSMSPRVQFSISKRASLKGLYTILNLFLFSLVSCWWGGISSESLRNDCKLLLMAFCKSRHQVVVLAPGIGRPV